MTENVNLEICDSVAIITLNEPDTRNALSAEIRAHLETIIPDLAADQTIRAVMITGKGTAFCAGGDVRSFSEPQTAPATRARIARSHAWIGKLLEGTKPVVTSVNGAAVGAGFGLAMLGDIVIASENAFFMGGFERVGVAADYGLARTLSQAVGSVRAKDILLTGRKISAHEALEMGLVSRLYPAEALEEEAFSLARKLASGPTTSFALTKELVNSSFCTTVDEYLTMEGFAQAMAFSTHDHRRGVEAFLNKQTPNFRGD